MENNQDRIDELKSIIDDNNIDLKQIYQSAGERVALPQVFSNDNETVKGYLGNLSELNEKLNDINIQIDDLHNSFKRISEIADREKEIGEEYSNLEKENKKLFLPIGKAAYFEWKDNPTDELSKWMVNLEELDKKDLSLENEIFKLENDESKKNLLNKIKEKSRIAVLRSKRKSNQATMNNLFKKAGEKLFKKDISYFENMNNESVSSFIANRKILENLDKEMHTLKDENVRIEKHLKSKFSSNKQKKAEEKLHSERDFVLSEKMSKLNQIGSYLYEEKLDYNDKEIKSFFKSASEIHDKNTKLNEEIERFKAELEIHKLDDEISDMKNNIKELQLTIEKSTSDIAEFNKEIRRARSEIKKLKKLTEDGAQELDK